MPEGTTDELLLARAEGGDQSAFVHLYERHRDTMFRFAYRLVGSVELAEDITHDCFLSLIRRPDKFDPERGSLRNYLYSATRNLSLKHFRNSGRETALDDLTSEPRIPVRDEPLPRLLDEELSSTVKRAIFNLPPLQREALILFEYEGLSLSEIASVVQTDIGAVKGRLHRAREQLRSTLRPYLNCSREIVTLGKA